MKHVFAILAIATTSACMEPVTTVQGAIPFAQLLAETEGRPYECVNYDSATDSCSTLSIFQPVSADTYIMTSAARFGVDVPIIEATTTMREQGTTQCTDFSDVTMSARGEQSFTLEAGLAQMEIELRKRGRFCGSYIPNGDGYIFHVTVGSQNELDDPNQPIRFFAAPKRLRLREQN